MDQLESRQVSLFNKQIILISEKDKCDIDFGLFLSVSFCFFKVTDMIVLLFSLLQLVCETTKLLCAMFMFIVGGLRL